MHFDLVNVLVQCCRIICRSDGSKIIDSKQIAETILKIKIIVYVILCFSEYSSIFLAF